MTTKANIIIIEDEKNICSFIEHILEPQGYRVISANTGKEGLQYITSEHPDVILLDLGLPDMDGLKLIEQVRSWSITPIIVISARTLEKSKIAALDLGADDYLTKPFGTGELLAVCNLLENTNRAKAYSRSENQEESADSLDGMFEVLQPLTPLSLEIRRCILSEEEIADDASPALRQIRRTMKNTNDKIHSQLSSYVSGQGRSYLQDAVVTMRNGRYCIPVKSEYKGQVPGMVHDQSSTGSTVFVEPMAIVKLNNELRELEVKEQAEIEIILSNLSQETAEHLEFIQDNLKKPLANELLFGSLVDGGQVTVALDKEKNELTYGFQSAQKHKAEAAH